MSDAEDIRQLATAVVSLAESNQGIGGILREWAATQAETNRILGRIHDQNATLLGHVEEMATAQRESDRAIRLLKSQHGRRLDKIEQVVGIETEPAAE